MNRPLYNAPLLFFVVVLLGLAAPAWAQTSVSGTISSNTTWTTSGSPYTLTALTTVASGVTLTVESGVIVQGTAQLLVDGTLDATGATFTTTETSPSRGVGVGIVARDGSTVTLSSSIVEYRGPEIQGGATVTLTGTTVQEAFAGLQFTNVTGTGSTTLQNATLTNNTRTATLSGAAPITASGSNIFTGNDRDGFFVNYSSHSGTWEIGGGEIALVFLQSYSGAGTTIRPGTILKIGPSDNVSFSGTVDLQGTAAAPIVVTSTRDDEVGGDAAGDGTASTPSVGNWNQFSIMASSPSTCQLTHLKVRYGNRGLRTNCSVSDSEFQSNRYGLTIDNNGTTHERNTFVANTEAPMSLLGLNSSNQAPTVQDNTFGNGNAFAGLGLEASQFTNTDFSATLYDTGTSYVLLTSIDLDSGDTLSVSEGVVVKAQNRFRSEINVESGATLDIAGTAAAPVTLTSINDDSVGDPQDTNQDGNTTVPRPTDWRGVAYLPGSAGSITNLTLRYADRGSVQFGSPAQNYEAGALNIVAATSLSVDGASISDTPIGVSIIGDTDPTISNASFANISEVPVALSFAANPTFTSTTLTNAGTVGIGILGEELRFSGTLSRRTFGGITNIAYVLLGDVTIAPGASVTVDPGVVIKAERSADLFVDGNLSLQGDATNGPVVFTSIKDDTRGNPLDTNGDGNSTAPAPGDWGTVQYRGVAAGGASSVSNAEFYFGTAGLILSNSGVSVTDVTLGSASTYGFVADGTSSPTVSGLTVSNVQADPLLLSVQATPSFSGVTFNENGTSGIGLLEGVVGGRLTSIFSQIRRYVGGNLVTQNATISPRSLAGFANVPYIIRDEMEVAAGAVLTMEPGTILKADRGIIVVSGALNATGTAGSRITFTALEDDSAGGDTNNDGNASQPRRGQGLGLYFLASSIDDQNALQLADLRYGSSNSYIRIEGEVFQAPVGVLDATVQIENVIIEQSASSGLDLHGTASPVVRNTQFLNISSTPVRLDLVTTAPTFENNQVANVGIVALGVNRATALAGTVPQRNFAGFTNITYYLHEDQEIAQGATLTVPAGTVFKSRRPALDIEGALQMQGTSSAPVVLTDLADDTYGAPADTEQNGDVFDGRVRINRWLSFASSTDDANTVIEHAILRYASDGAVLNSASPTFRNTRFANLDYGIVLNSLSAPVVENNTFADLTRTPLLISLINYPATATGNVIEGSTYEAIGVRDETLVQDVTLPKRTFAGREGIPYHFERGYTVGTGAVLTIAAGNVLKFGDPRQSSSTPELVVRKGLVAEGTDAPSGKIVFTYLTDDFYGGDTNRDGDASAPRPGQWNGITFTDEAVDASSRLDNVVVRYAGYLTTGAIRTESASPTITNSVLTQNRIAVKATGASNPVVTGNDIYENEDFGVENTGSFTIDATNNWWGADSGPTHASNPDGTGDTVSDNVTFSPFVGGGASQPVLGDVSSNGSVSPLDGSLILQHVAGNTVLTGDSLVVADVSGNGSVSAMDASFVLQYVVGLIDALPEEAQKNSGPRLVAPPSTAVLALGRSSATFEAPVRVPVRVSQVQALLALDAALTYDTEVLTLADVEVGPLAASRSFDWGSDAESGTVRLAMAGTEAPADDDVLATLVFRVAEDVRGTVTTPLAVTRVTANETDRTAKAVAGQVVVEGLPTAFEVGGNYPNPVRHATTIPVALPEAALVRIEVFNVLGQQVATLVDRQLEAGRHDIQWTADRSTLGSGIYFFRVHAGTQTATGRMTLVR